MAYSHSPDVRDVRLDPEVGHGTSPAGKKAGYRPTEVYNDRGQDRRSARELDRMVEEQRFTRARKDLERAFPRARVPDVDARKARPLPIPDSIRLPPSSRQRKARSVNKRTAQDQLPASGYKATAQLITEPENWSAVGAALTDVRGDAQHLDEKTRAHVQRIDRAIQTAEQNNDRGHVVYCAVTVPHELPVDAKNLPSTLQTGSRLDFDRFTMATHAIHELDPILGDTEVVFEMETTRGMYLGRSDSLDDTSHLLPRGMQWEVASTHQGRYRRPDGTLGRRTIVQLRDVTEG
nr:hypothetical protein [Rhodococcus sp. (in: high G+C Gram-positive bacteria)]